MNTHLRDASLLLARVVLGGIFIAHGWQKFFTNGMDRVSAGFAGMGIPQPTFSAYLAGGIELVAGVALIVGILTPLAAGLLAAEMASAIYFVHAPHGVFVQDNGFELVAALGVGVLLIAVFGAGRVSLDELFRG